MKIKTIHIFIFLVNAIASWTNMVYFADNIAKAPGGYFVALGVVPFVVGLFTSYIGTLALGKGFMNGIKAHWTIFISGQLGGFLPIGYAILILS
jgi:hypothetical protein